MEYIINKKPRKHGKYLVIAIPYYLTSNNLITTETIIKSLNTKEGKNE